MRKLTLFLILLASAPVVANAQPSPSQAPTTGGAATIAMPPPPPVSDPMLAPAPAPKRVLSSWAEGVSYLRARSTDLKIALAEVLQAESVTRIALAQYLPWINANNAGGATYTHQIITHAVANGIGLSASGIVTTTRVPIPNSYGGSLVLQQAVVNLPEFDQISIDELSEDAARLSVDAEKRTLVLSLANQIVAVVTAEREAEINRVGLRVALEQLEITTRKQSLGAANGLDVVRARQNAANARATLVTGDESLREAREMLGLALGIPEETGVAPNINVGALAANAMESCHVVADLDQRPDIAQAEVQLEVAKRNLRNVWYTFLPSLSVSSTLSGTSPVSAGFPNPLWNVQGNLEVPIWDGGTRYGNLRNARAAQDIAAQQLEALRRQAIIQVEQAQRQLLVAEASDRVASEQRDLAQQNDTMTQTAYASGQGTSLELVTASEAHRQAEINLALQDFNVVKARILALLALATCPW
jgi:outer membrane protein, multidrug efflux system